MKKILTDEISRLSDVLAHHHNVGQHQKRVEVVEAFRQNFVRYPMVQRIFSEPVKPELKDNLEHPRTISINGFFLQNFKI